MSRTGYSKVIVVDWDLAAAEAVPAAYIQAVDTADRLEADSPGAAADSPVADNPVVVEDSPAVVADSPEVVGDNPDAADSPAVVAGTLEAEAQVEAKEEVVMAQAML